MSLDPQARMLLDAIKALALPDLTTLAPEDARAIADKRTRGMPPGPQATVTAHTLAGPLGAMPVRGNRPPASYTPDSGTLPSPKVVSATPKA